MNILTTEIIESIKIKRSEFIAHLSYAADLNQAKNYIAQVSKKHRKAHHNCWGYLIGDQGEISHCSDNGEPSGAAGKPIVGMLRKYQLTNIVAVVTRYYGGVKLGVRGLIDAYSGITEQAIVESSLIPLVKTAYYCVEVGYKELDTLQYQLREINGRIEEADYSDKVILRIAADDHVQNDVESLLNEWSKAGKIRMSPTFPLPYDNNGPVLQ